MIYTITMNPALDYIMTIKEFNISRTNRSVSERIKPGGKGINVSIVLKNLGVDSTVMGFVAGFTGDALEKELQSYNLTTDFFHLSSGMTRINIKLSGDSETEINANGPVIDHDSMEKFLTGLDKLNEDDYLVIAGNIPSQMPKSTYETIIKRAKAQIILDTNGLLLLNCLKYRPFLIKPNHCELGELFNCNIDLDDENCIETAVALAQKLQLKGARNVCVSLSYRGAIVVTEDGNFYYEKGRTGNVISSVGAGDSMVAGFLAGYLQSRDYALALKTGVAAASATCFSGEPATQKDIKALLG